MQATPQGKQQLIPWRRNTQQVFQLNQTDNSKAHALGSTVSYRLDKTGALTGILFYLVGTVTLSAAGALANLGPWSLVNRFRLTLNNNAIVVADIDGYQAYLLGLIMDRVFGADGAGNFTPHALTFSVPVAMGANAWVVPYFIPISLNRGSDALMGAINMQAQTANLVLEVVLASSGADFVTNFTSLSLTGEVHNFMYELRKGTEVPPLVLITTQQKTENILATGLTRHEIVPQGDLYQLNGTVILNGVRNSADVGQVEFVAGTNKFNYIETPRMNLFQFQRNYGKPAVTGVFTRDFFNAMEEPNAGDLRDVIHTNNFTKLEWNVRINSGAGLGANNNFFHVVERRMIPLAL